MSPILKSAYPPSRYPAAFGTSATMPWLRVKGALGAVEAEEAVAEDEETGCRRRERLDEPPRSLEGRGKRRRKQGAAAGRPKRALPEGGAEALRGRWKQGRRTGARQDEGGGRRKRGRPEDAEDGGQRKAGRRAGGGNRGRPEGHC